MKRTRDSLVKRKQQRAMRRAKGAQKLAHQLVVTFEQEPEFDVVGVALIGQGYRVSRLVGGDLSDGQVAYRMKLARPLFGLRKYDSLTRQYHRGEGEFAEIVRDTLLPAVRAAYMARLIALRKHPTAQVAESRERK